MTAAFSCKTSSLFQIKLERKEKESHYNIIVRYGSPARNFEWGYPGAYPSPGPAQNGHQQPPGPGLGPNAATADVIAAQSQDYVDENLAAFQVRLHVSLDIIYTT